MNCLKCLYLSSFVVLGTLVATVETQAALPPPVLVAPADGASLVQAIKIDWDPVIDPNGEIGSYTWQVAKTVDFNAVVLEGFTSLLFPGVPAATDGQVSGLANGIYFWRVKATSLASGDSAWSPPRSFTVTGLGPAPGTPVISAPANNAQFHPVETFNIVWSPVSGANYYIVEVDDEPTFSYPLSLSTSPLTFGTKFGAGWGNVIPNIYYRVRAVSADNVRGLPSNTLTVHVINNAPIPPPPSLVAPVAGASVSLPFFFDWTDTANPQIPGYDLDVDTDPNFSHEFGVLLVENIARSDYMLDAFLDPGTYYWRVRALHGAAVGPWSPGRAITLTEPVATPPGLLPFYIFVDPIATSGGNSIQARLVLNAPAPAGGAQVTVASDFPQGNLPNSVVVPAGKTDAVVTPITTVPVAGPVVSSVRASYGGGEQQSSIGLFGLMLSTDVSAESVIGGNSFTGTITLLDPAPTGGTVVRLVSSNIEILRPPPTVTVPAGATGATFNVETSAIPVATIATIDAGIDLDGSAAPRISVIVGVPGNPQLPPSLSSLSLSKPRVKGGQTLQARVTLTGPAPAGGAVVPLSGSLAGQVITPPNVTVPAGKTSAAFTITTPPVLNPQWVVIQGNYGTFNGMQHQVLEVDPGPPGPPTLFALGLSQSVVTAGDIVRGTAGLFAPAPSGGAAIRLRSHNPAVAQVPSSLSIPAGNSADSFNITTGSVPIETPVQIDASVGGVTKTVFLNVEPNPDDEPLLESVTLSPTSVKGGTNSTGTVTLSAPAPAGGIFVTLATSDPNVAAPPPVVGVAGGETSADFIVTTFPVSRDTVVTITGFYGSGVESADLTVTKN